jgi:hypothetical protein
MAPTREVLVSPACPRVDLEAICSVPHAIELPAEGVTPVVEYGPIVGRSPSSPVESREMMDFCAR